MAEIASVFLYLLTQTRLYHWQTPVYIKHKAAGNYYEAMDGLVDKFIETYQGRYGRIMYQPFQANFQNISDEQFLVELAKFVDFLATKMPAAVQRDTDLMNIRDEMLGTTNHAIYLLNLQ